MVSSGRAPIKNRRRAVRMFSYPDIMTEPMPHSPLDSAFQSCRPYFFSAGLFSLAINLLYLASPLYMLQVYNRAVSSGSGMTLLMLTVILAVTFAAQALLDLVRGRILTRAGIRLENRLSEALLEVAFTRHVADDRAAPIRDFDRVRQTISGPAMYPLFDLPWTPIFIAAAFLLHPWLGVFTIGCGVMLVLLAIVGERILRHPVSQASAATSRVNSFTEMSLRQAETVIALGMTRGVIRRWRDDRLHQVDRQRQVADRSGGMGSVSKSLRLTMQSLALGVGAWLVIAHMSSAGVMFAGSLLLSRTLQPLEQIIGSWRSFIGARAAYVRLAVLLKYHSEQGPVTNLPAPRGHLVLDNVHFTQPRAQRLVLRALSLSVDPGTALGVIGQSGAGKTALANLLIGVLPASVGSVRLDGVAVANWPRGDLGQYIGYLPQQVDFLAGTVSANIGRFESDADDDVIAAARLAGVHEAILQLPAGYDTPIGEGGSSLPGGLRQRLALARAVFRMPPLVVLDEPASNLDAEGERALALCIASLKQHGSTIAVISPRQSTLAVIDRLLLLRNGGIEMFGERDAVIAQLNGAPAPSSDRHRPMVARNA